jgi:hypothetical protein
MSATRRFVLLLTAAVGLAGSADAQSGRSKSPDLIASLPADLRRVRGARDIKLTSADSTYMALRPARGASRGDRIPSQGARGIGRQIGKAERDAEQLARI